MKKSIIKNYIYNLVYQILSLILPLLATPHLSRTLGAEGVGVYSYTISIVTYFVLFGSLGIAMYAQREIAYVQADKEKRSKIFWEVFILRMITLLISMAIFYFIFAFKGEYAIYYKILLLYILANIFDISAFFQGMEEFKKTINRNLLVKILSIISIFIFIKKPTDIWKYLLIYALSNLIGNASLWFYLPKYISKPIFKSLKLINHIKPTIALFIPQIAIQIYTVLDKTMIGSLVLDKSEVGYYEQSQKITVMILTLVTSLGTVMLPRIANKFANGEKEEIKKYIHSSFNFVYFLSIPMMFGLVAVAKDLIPWFLGDGFHKSLEITYIISPIILFISISNVIGIQYLLPTKKQKKYTVSVLVGAITNVILNFIFIPKFLSIGAAIATVIAEGVVTGTQLYFIRKDFNVKKIFTLSLKYFLSAIIMLFIIVLVNITVLKNIQVVFRMGIDVIIGLVIYIGLLVILKDEFIRRLINKILNYISKGEKYVKI